MDFHTAFTPEITTLELPHSACGNNSYFDESSLTKPSLYEEAYIAQSGYDGLFEQYPAFKEWCARNPATQHSGSNATSRSNSPAAHDPGFDVISTSPSPVADQDVYNHACSLSPPTISRIPPP
ncbi:hypothetical protein D9615_010689 [Tricholomella constricta]|uniref:Uncharacterized protein n=1 Tax=Tricholomella constricta TaxID=117010 RepID=A0A8H5LQJ5_9AGAR|nr:hypothetical protein D9615_010689 [Tricholomella constricta]